MSCSIKSNWKICPGIVTDLSIFRTCAAAVIEQTHSRLPASSQPIPLRLQKTMVICWSSSGQKAVQTTFNQIFTTKLDRQIRDIQPEGPTGDGEIPVPRPVCCSKLGGCDPACQLRTGAAHRLPVKTPPQSCLTPRAHPGPCRKNFSLPIVPKSPSA